MNKKCFLCGSEQYHIIHGGVRNNPSLDVYKCNQCGLVRLSDFVTNDEYYEKAIMRQDETEETIEQIRTTARPDDVRRYQFIQRMIENKTYLDFGCGAGGVLHYAKAEACQVYGVELETAMRDALISEGIRCFASVKEACSVLGKEIDVISLFHVLEHLRNPIEILEELKELLGDHGRMVIEVPNADDALLTLYDNEAFSDFTYWESHLYLYTNTTLRSLVEKAGMRVRFMEQIQRYPLSNTLYWLAKGKPGGHKEWSAVSNEVLDREYGNQLAKLGLADTIIAIVEC